MLKLWERELGYYCNTGNLNPMWQFEPHLLPYSSEASIREQGLNAVS